MFSSAVQPPILSLFSSTSTDCLSLFSTHTDATLPSDSFVHVLDDTTSLPQPTPPKTLMKAPTTRTDTPDTDHASADDGHLVSGPVLHIQSPTLPRGYIRCPPVQSKYRDLGIKLAWLHMQVRNMGREWSFEVGVVDVLGREGRVRCSTFQKQPRVRSDSGGGELPLLHIPLKFPASSSRPLTAWCSISLHLPTLLPHFASIPSQPERAPQAPLPSGRFSHVSYVKVYANCRLRRVWFTAERRDAATEPWEFGLYSR